MGLGRINAKSARASTAPKKFMPRRASAARSIAGALYEQAMEYEIVDKNARPPVLRPSSFPLCSVLVYKDLAVGAAANGRFERSMNAGGGYFTSVGTAAHTNIQTYIGKSKKIYGHWKCINHLCPEYHKARDRWKTIVVSGKKVRKLVHGKPTREFSCDNVCPECKYDMEYVELTVKHKRVEGHIDCVIMLDHKRKRIWVADYKTCTGAKVDSGRTKLPMRVHLRQIPSYCHILEKEYGYVVEGFSLIYICRDNPYKFYEHAEPWTDAWRKRAAKEFKLERLRYKAGVKAWLERDPDIAIAEKPCKSLSHYNSEMAFYDPCPFLDVCFIKGSLKAALKVIQKQNPYTDKQIEKVRPRLSV